MTSGIYRLTFSSGKYYVGKSLDIDTRWKQHFNKFALGKAARAMQLEFDRCGPPQTEVIFECHKDHIDILEEWLIDQLKGPDMLNTTYPDITRTEEIARLIDNNRELLQKSTWEHLFIINYMADAVEKAEATVAEYKESGFLIDETYTEAVDMAIEAQEELQETKAQLELAQREVYRYKNMGFWERLFAN